jgi:hypothetical protein
MQRRDRGPVGHHCPRTGLDYSVAAKLRSSTFSAEDPTLRSLSTRRLLSDVVGRVLLPAACGLRSAGNIGKVWSRSGADQLAVFQDREPDRLAVYEVAVQHDCFRHVVNLNRVEAVEVRGRGCQAPLCGESDAIEVASDIRRP